MAGEIFISYRRTRESEAVRLENVLRSKGFADYQMFRDVRGLFAGETFDRQLADTLRQTRVVLLLLGEGDAPQLLTNDWVSRELRSALAARRPIVPIALLPGGEDAAKRDWPPEFRSILDTQFLTFSKVPKPAEVQRLVGVVRRNGVRPLQSMKQWSSIRKHNPVSEVRDQLIAFAKDNKPGIALLKGDSGTGRSHVMNEVADFMRDNDSAVAVGFHRGLRNPLVGVDGAAVYDWIEGALARDVELSDCILDLLSCGLSPRYLSRSVIDRLDARQRSSLLTDASESSEGMATGAVRILERLSKNRRLLLMVDDVDLADSGSQEVVRLLAVRMRLPNPPPITVIVASANNSLLELFFRGVGALHTVELEPNLKAMLLNSDMVEDDLIERLTAVAGLGGRGLSAAQCAVYLGHLAEQDLLVRTKGEKWSLKPGARLPTMGEVLDDEINNVIPPGLQQILEIGALCGTRFRVRVADSVASAENPSDETAARLLSYDQDEMIVRATAGLGPDRMSFASSMWWQHLRSRRIAPCGTPNDPQEVRRLAEELATATTLDGESYDDWATVGLLYDSIDDNEQAGAAFLCAARIARLTRANETAERGYKEAARRLELHAIASAPGTDRAGELLRAAYCLFRAATVVDSPGDSIDSQDDLLDQADTLLSAVDKELHRLGSTVTPIDLDAMVTHGADVNAETTERLMLQWRSLSAFVALERGQRALALRRRNKSALNAFYRALLLGEAGLSGSLYHELVVAASAGLALSLSREVNLTDHRGRAGAAFEHAARAAIIAARSPYASAQVAHERDRFAEARKWLADSRVELASRLDQPVLARSPDGQPTDESGLIELLAASYGLVSTPERLSHPTLTIERGRQLLEKAVDLEPFVSSPSFLVDLEIYAHAHDQFRFADGARLLRLWRDLGGSDVPRVLEGVDNEWHNPILLHGMLAARWLDCDLGAGRIIGDARLQRVSVAMETHTVGAPDLEDAFVKPFVWTVHLADTFAVLSEDPDLERVWALAFEQGGLERAYAMVYALRARRLRADGKFVSPSTELLERRVSQH
jgi:AAA ATPase domain/TIR domain